MDIADRWEWLHEDSNEPTEEEKREIAEMQWELENDR